MNGFIKELCDRKPQLQPLAPSIEEAFRVMVHSFKNNGKLLICGNGGSAADADHIAGELIKNYLMPRPLKEELSAALLESGHADASFLASTLQRGLPAKSLGVHGAAITAVMNDMSPDLIFAQQVMAFGLPGDVLLCISTSGNARNVTLAAVSARFLGMKTIALTGRTGGELARECHTVIVSPGEITPDIQENHISIYHALCAAIEGEVFA
ncbi:MAG TPA: SIS domain-containing protein [Spirochaetes bacterium]|nr:SIS domain-containing protein [Spirochaetota bacterium]